MRLEKTAMLAGSLFVLNFAVLQTETGVRAESRNDAPSLSGTTDYHIEISAFEHLTPDNGLSQSTVYNMLQDSEGYMWFATQDGLNRYDGYRMTVYGHDPDDPGSISYNRVFSIYEDSRGTIWVGTLGRGLNRFDRDLDRFEYYPVDPDDTESGYYGNSVIDMLEDRRGRFWVAKSTGLYLLDRETGDLTAYVHDESNPESLSNNSVTALHEDSEGRFWVGTRGGLNLMDRETETFTRYLHAPDDHRALNHPYIYTIYEDSQGTLWFGTRGGGLHRYVEDSDDFQRHIYDEQDPFSISGNQVTGILEDFSGNIWVATENNGLNRFDRDRGRFIRYSSDPNNPSSLNSNSLLSLYISDRNLLWAGTFDGGVSITSLEPPPFEHYKPEINRPRSLSHPAVLSFGEDHAGNIWVGTDGGGVNRFDKETREFTTLRHEPGNPNSLSSDIILEVFEDSGRRLWFGTYQGGITVYDPSNHSYRHYLNDPGDPSTLSNNEVWKIYEDRDGTIWIGTCAGGLNRYHPETDSFEAFMHDPDDPSSLSNNFISTIYEDSRGRLWVGSYGGGLSLLDRDSGSFTNYTIFNSGISDGVVVTIHEDRSGRFWIGTKGGGLNLFEVEDETFTVYTTSHGLPNNVIHGILEDDNGRLWISTNNGLTRFNPSTETFTHYNQVHGIQSREFKEGSYYKDSNGYFYFGGINGFNRFRPENILPDPVVAPIVLTDFRIDNVSVTPGEDGPLSKHISRADRITVPYSASVLGFEFAALNFDLNKNIEYAYRLEGFDSDWNEVDRSRWAVYTNLDPGTYHFQVMATNNDGFWSDNPAGITLVITPPFWRTGWFVFLTTGGIFLIVFLVYRYRVHKMKVRNIELQRRVDEKTAELRESNTTKDKLLSILAHDLNNAVFSLLGFVDLLRESLRDENLEEAREYGERLQNTTSHFRELLENLLNWARSQSDRIEHNPETIVLSDLVDRHINLQKSRAAGKSIRLISSVDPDENLAVYADQNMLSLVLRNLIQNALKFTKKGGNVEVSAEGRGDRVEISVIDDGIGMSRKQIEKVMHSAGMISTPGTGSEEGTGLGLPLSHDFIRRNGGSLHIESEEGKGSIFTVSLPRSTEVAESPDHISGVTSSAR